MKKIFALIVLISLVAFPQRTVIKPLGTVSNSVDETGYLDLTGWSQIDSISVTFVAKGELDVDSVTVYRAVKVPGVGYKKDITVLGNFTVTLDLADGVWDIEPLFVSNATVLNGAALRGVDAIYYVTRGATSGNDPTDPNAGWLMFQIWGTK